MSSHIIQHKYIYHLYDLSIISIHTRILFEEPNSNYVTRVMNGTILLDPR